MHGILQQVKLRKRLLTAAFAVTVAVAAAAGVVAVQLRPRVSPQVEIAAPTSAQTAAPDQVTVGPVRMGYVPPGFAPADERQEQTHSPANGRAVGTTFERPFRPQEGQRQDRTPWFWVSVFEHDGSVDPSVEAALAAYSTAPNAPQAEPMVIAGRPALLVTADIGLKTVQFDLSDRLSIRVTGFNLPQEALVRVAERIEAR